MATDPVCGMDADEATAKHKNRIQGSNLLLLRPGCKKAFEGEPETYLDPNYKSST